MAKMHHGMGVAYQRFRQPTRARQHFDKALALYSLESDLSAAYRVENDLGDLLLHEGQIESAEQHFLKAFAGAEELRIDRRGRGHVLNSLGAVNLKKGQLDEARKYLNEAAEAGEAFGERIVLSEAHVLLGQLDEREGNSDGADAHFQQAIEALGELEMPARLRDSHMEYARVLDARGDVGAAARRWKLAAEVGKSADAGTAFDSQDVESTEKRKRATSAS